MTIDGGGWTRVLEAEETKTGYMPTYAIDDHGLSYGQVLIVAEPSHKISYFAPGEPTWTSKGFDASKNFVQFNNVKYKVAMPGETKIPQGYQFLTLANYRRLGDTPDQCNFNNVHIPANCFYQVVITTRGKLKAVGDINSDRNINTEVNKFWYKFHVYIR